MTSISRHVTFQEKRHAFAAGYKGLVQTQYQMLKCRQNVNVIVISRTLYIQFPLRIFLQLSTIVKNEHKEIIRSFLNKNIQRVRAKSK